MTQLTKWEIFGWIWTTVIGVLLHFAYEWLGGGRIVAVFAAVNESTWEHLKLLFVPEALYSILEYRKIGYQYPGLLWERTKAILLGMAAIVVGFYTYSGVLGRNIPVLDIGLFFVGAAVTGWFVVKREASAQKEGKRNLAAAVLAVVMLCFAVFTFWPGRIGIFEDPVGKNRDEAVRLKSGESLAKEDRSWYDHREQQQ